MRRIMTSFSRDESGAAAIEYALIGSGVALAIVAMVTLIGPNLAAIFQDLVNRL